MNIEVFITRSDVAFWLHFSKSSMNLSKKYFLSSRIYLSGLPWPQSIPRMFFQICKSSFDGKSLSLPQTQLPCLKQPLIIPSMMTQRKRSSAEVSSTTFLFISYFICNCRWCSSTQQYGFVLFLLCSGRAWKRTTNIFSDKNRLCVSQRGRCSWTHRYTLEWKAGAPRSEGIFVFIVAREMNIISHRNQIQWHSFLMK